VIVMAEVLKDEHVGALDPLPTVADKINALFDKAAKADEKAESYRISAGLELAKARGRVDAGEAGEITWGAWCAEHVRRSEGDIRKVLAIANAADPTKAAAAERQRNQEAVARHRAYVRAVSGQSIDTVKRNIQLLSAAERSVLADWLIEIVAADQRGAEAGLSPATTQAVTIREETAETYLASDAPAASVVPDPPPQSTAPSPEPTPEAEKPPETMADPAEEVLEPASAEDLEHQEPHTADLPNPTPLQPRPPAPATEAVEPPTPVANPVTEGAAAPDNLPSGMPPRTVVSAAVTHRVQEPDEPEPAPIALPPPSALSPPSPPAPGTASAPPEPSTPAQGPVDLMSVWEALPQGHKQSTSRWCRSDAYAHPKDDPPADVPQVFVVQWFKATEPEKRAFLHELNRLDNLRWYPPRSQDPGAEKGSAANADSATPTANAA